MDILPTLNRTASEMVEDQYLLPLFAITGNVIQLEFVGLGNRCYRTVSVKEGGNVFKPIRDYIEEKRKEYGNLASIDIKVREYTENRITLRVRVKRVKNSIVDFERAKNKYYRAVIFDIVVGDGRLEQLNRRVIDEGIVDEHLTETLSVFGHCRKILDKYEINRNTDPNIEITKDGDKVFFELIYINDLTEE